MTPPLAGVRVVEFEGIGPGPLAGRMHSPFYDVYECADGGFITLGALEPQFYSLLLDKLGFSDVDPAEQYQRDK